MDSFEDCHKENKELNVLFRSITWIKQINAGVCAD